MIRPIPPAFIFILGSLLIPLLRGRWRSFYLLFLPIPAFINLLSLEPGTSWQFQFLRYDLILARVDGLSLSVAIVFVIIGFLGILYSLHVRENGHHMASLLYMGSALGVVFSGDYFSLFMFWEIMAVASVLLIWYQREKESLDAGFRYILMHIFGGSCLLTGLILQVLSTGTTAFAPLTNPWAYVFMVAGIGLNTALIPLHTWLPDAYPRATITGSVFLAVFTTKAGVYTFARFFPGELFLTYMGGIMALYGVIFALLQNDTRKLLSYHIISQLGYMVAGVGVGTSLGMDGSIAHLFNNNLFKPLLFMCIGSIIYVTGKSRLTELGGLARQMPLTCLTCVIASLSISGVPGFNGFVSKGMVVAAVTEAHQPIVELMLRLASVGTFLSFAKLTYFSFFAQNKVMEPKEPPWNMQLAMVATAFACILTGVYPRLLFDILPNGAHGYHPFTEYHVFRAVQVLLLAGSVFSLTLRAFSPHGWLVLDFDYFYRMAFRKIGWFCAGPLHDLRLRMQAILSRGVTYLSHLSRNPFSLSETAIKYFTSQGGGRSEASTKPGQREKGGYDENVYRYPMGLGVLIAILFLFLYGLIYLVKS
jgi:multicomponent Na+:H+ antiporter subunit D